MSGTSTMDFVSPYLDKSVGRWVSIVLVSLVGLSLAQTFRSWYRLRHFKGPLIASVSQLWLARVVVGGNAHRDFHKVNDKYGVLARIGPNDLITSDPAVMRRILAVRSPYRRSDWYVGMRFDPHRDNIESIMDDDRHNQLRLMMAAGYAGKENENLEGTIDRNVLALVDLIRSKYLSTDSESKPMDFGRKAQYFTLDVISDAAYREPFGYMAADTDLHGYIQAVEEIINAALLVTVFPWLNWILRLRIMKAILPSDTDTTGTGKLLGITKQVVGKRFGKEKIVRKDMLGSFIAHGLTQEEAESETLLQIIAGSDTTATAIRATLLYLIMHPRVTYKLRSEISNHQISSPIKDSEARQMPYLQAVIKEGLRIFPPVTGLQSKVVPPEGDIIDGRFVPGGTKIGYGAYGIFRDSKTWGEDAELFRPERWLEGSPEQIKKMDSTLELVFGYGKYQCLGKSIAMLELNKVFVELLRQFDLQIVDPTKPWNSVCHGIFCQSEMWLTAYERP